MPRVLRPHHQARRNHVSRLLAEGGDTFQGHAPGVYHPGDVLQRPLAGQQMYKDVQGNRTPFAFERIWESYQKDIKTKEMSIVEYRRRRSPLSHGLSKNTNYETLTPEVVILGRQSEQTRVSK